MRGTRQDAIVFLGGGRITGALLAGLRLAKYGQPIVVHDRNADKLRQLENQYRVQTEPDLRRAVARAHFLIVAVRPDSVRELLQQIGETEATLAVSLAAGIPLRNLRDWTRPAIPWARAMPSPVARSGRGLSAITFARNFPAAAGREVRSLFSCVGQVLEIPESKFDAFTVTFSSSHGYHALNALAGAARKLGLDRKTAMTAAAHALADGILAWRDSDNSLEELLQEAATPGGTAAATMTSMDKSGYKRIVEKGLRAGVDQAKKNAKR